MSKDYNKRGSRAPQSQDYYNSTKNTSEPSRYTATDFEDNEPTPSLWTGSGGDSFFDSSSVKKEKGDIVTILVMEDLKEKIQNELERAFSKSKDNSSDPSSPEKNGTDAKKVFDKISSIVNKEIRSNHILLIGRKELIFENIKRLVEVSALVNRKDITSDDTINSTKILQTKIRTLR
jgi:flagellar L-ring protein FlgH